MHCVQCLECHAKVSRRSTRLDNHWLFCRSLYTFNLKEVMIIGLLSCCAFIAPERQVFKCSAEVPIHEDIEHRIETATEPAAHTSKEMQV